MMLVKYMNTASISKRFSPRTCVSIANRKPNISVNDGPLLLILWWVTASPLRFCVERDTQTETTGRQTLSENAQTVFSA